MNDVLKATMTADLAAKIGGAAAVFLSGRIDIGDGAFLVLPEQIGLNIRRLTGFVRITPLGDVRVDRPGIDVFLDHLDVFPNGSVRAEVKRFGFSLEKDIR